MILSILLPEFPNLLIIPYTFQFILLFLVVETNVDLEKLLPFYKTIFFNKNNVEKTTKVPVKKKIIKKVKQKAIVHPANALANAIQNTLSNIRSKREILDDLQDTQSSLTNPRSNVELDFQTGLVESMQVNEQQQPQPNLIEEPPDPESGAFTGTSDPVIPEPEVYNNNSEMLGDILDENASISNLVKSRNTMEIPDPNNNLGVSKAEQNSSLTETESVSSSKPELVIELQELENIVQNLPEHDSRDLHHSDLDKAGPEPEYGTPTADQILENLEQTPIQLVTGQIFVPNVSIIKSSYS